MCHSRINNSKYNWLHEHLLRIIYFDKQSSYEALLENDGYVSIHNRNLQVIATEMYKVSKDLSPPGEQHYNLRDNAEFTIRVIRTV